MLRGEKDEVGVGACRGLQRLLRLQWQLQMKGSLHKSWHCRWLILPSQRT